MSLLGELCECFVVEGQQRDYWWDYFVWADEAEGKGFMG